MLFYYLCSLLHTKVQYRVLLLLAMFLVTILPLNLFHHHAEEEHAAVLISHRHQDEHHCELDTHFCQPGLADHCSHQAHIQQSLAKCFSCQFHFVNSLVLAKELVMPFFTETSVRYLSYSGILFSGSTILLLNKGPPVAFNIA